MPKPILILGTVPLPIGGVTIHVKRLLEFLDEQKYPYSFINIKESGIIFIVLNIIRSKRVHLNTSNSKFMFLCGFICWLFSTKLIITYHGNLGRKKGFDNTLEKWAIKLATVPIVLNDTSYTESTKLNSKSEMIAAFIPPIKIEPLPESISKKILHLKSQFDYVFCTNAFNVSIDIDGNETYGVSDLISIFSSLTNHALVFSDPTGNYEKYLSDRNIQIPDNVYIITTPHDFINVIKMTDCFIRSTTTDGDSLSVKEGLYFGKPVIASNCVERPTGCTLFETRNLSELKNCIESFDKKSFTAVEVNNGAAEILKLYSRI